MAHELSRPRWGLSRRSSGDPVRDVGDLVGRFFDDWLSPRMSGQARGWAPAVDMIDRDDEIVLRADLPGLEQKDIEVTVDSGVLTVRGERQEEREAKENDYYCCERWAGNFSRSMMLPPGVDTSGIKATFKNGVLEVHIPKSQQTMQKRIQINAA